MADDEYSLVWLTGGLGASLPFSSLQCAIFQSSTHDPLCRQLLSGSCVASLNLHTSGCYERFWSFVGGFQDSPQLFLLSDVNETFEVYPEDGSTLSVVDRIFPFQGCFCCIQFLPIQVLVLVWAFMTAWGVSQGGQIISAMKRIFQGSQIICCPTLQLLWPFVFSHLLGLLCGGALLEFAILEEEEKASGGLLLVVLLVRLHGVLLLFGLFLMLCRRRLDERLYFPAACCRCRGSRVRRSKQRQLRCKWVGIFLLLNLAGSEASALRDKATIGYHTFGQDGATMFFSAQNKGDLSRNEHLRDWYNRTKYGDASCDVFWSDTGFPPAFHSNGSWCEEDLGAFCFSAGQSHPCRYGEDRLSSWPCGIDEMLCRIELDNEGLFRDSSGSTLFCPHVFLTSEKVLSFCEVDSKVSCVWEVLDLAPCTVHDVDPRFAGSLTDSGSGDSNEEHEEAVALESVANRLHDEVFLMQVGPPTEDLVAQYIRAQATNFRDTTLLVWYHPAEAIRRLQANHRIVAYNHELPAGPHLPYALPQVIVTPVRHEHFVPVLVDYRSSTVSFRGTFLLEATRMPTVYMVFTQVYPMNQCVWVNDCFIIMQTNAGPEHYQWGQVFPVFEGLYFVMIEQSPEPSSGSSTEGGSGGGNDSGFSTDSEGSYGSCSAHASEDNPERIIGVALMQTSWELQFAAEEASLRESLGLLPSSAPETMYWQPSFGVVPVNGHLEQSDRLELMLETLGIVEQGQTLAATTWMTELFVAVVPRLCVYQPKRSMSKSFMTVWNDFEEHAPFWITLVSPTPQPLTFQRQPFHLASLTRAQREKHQRLFVVDIVFKGLPRRAGVIVDAGDTVRQLAIKFQLAHLCSLEQYNCILPQSRGGIERSWNYFDVVEEPHGFSFRLLFEDRKSESCQCTGAESDEGHLMQQIVLRRPSPLQLYLQDFNRESVRVYVWIHHIGAEIVQTQSSECDVDVRRDVELQCEELWVDKGMPRFSKITEVSPPPVLIALPKPHIIVSSTFDTEEVPLLCQANVDGRVSLMTVLVNTRNMPTRVAGLFDLAIPQHDCEYGSDCYLLWGHRRFEYAQDFDPYPGAFIRVIEWTRHDSRSSTDLCTSGSLESLEEDDHSWMSSWSDLVGQADMDMEDIQAAPSVSSAPVQQQPGGNTATPFEDDLLLQSPLFMQNDILLQMNLGSDQGEDSESHSLQLSLVVSNVSDLPPPVDTGVNREVDWLSTWVQARAFLTGYHQVPMAQSYVLVHLIQYNAQGTSCSYATCPGYLLSHQQQIYSFIQWCIQNSCQLYREYSRVFCVENELYQGVPSLIIAQMQPEGQAPLLVQVTDQVTAIYLVYQAYPIERVAGILDWISQQIDIVLPFDTCFRGHRVQGGHDIQIPAGSVLQVRVQTWRENQFPLSLTTASGPSFDLVTHSTWESAVLQTTEAAVVDMSEQGDRGSASSSAIHLPREIQQQHTLEPRRPWIDEDEADTASFYHFPGGLVLRPPLSESHVPEMDEEMNFESEWMQYVMWRQHVRRVLRTTQHSGVQRICNEALAYRRARRAWPGFALVLLPDTWFTGLPQRSSAMDLEGTLVYVRDFLAEQLPDDLPVSRGIHLIGVFPYLTPFEQGGDDLLHLLVDPSPEVAGAPVLLLEDHWSQPDFSYWPMKLPESLWTTDLLRTLGRLEECQDDEILCTLIYDGFELPRLVTWRPWPGMKLSLQIQKKINSLCKSFETEEEDYFSNMQLPENRPDGGRGEPMRRHGHDYDPVYDFVQREAGNPEIPQGGIVKFWLIPGSGAAIHDAVIRLDMRPQVPDWTGWVEQSWRMARLSSQCAEGYQLLVENGMSFRSLDRVKEMRNKECAPSWLI